MYYSVKSLEEFISKYPEAYKQLVETVDLDEDDPYFTIEDFTSIKELIQEIGSNDGEEYDGDYFNDVYYVISNDRKWKYEINTSRYVKDMIICDARIDDELFIVDMISEAIKVKELEAITLRENRRKWENLFHKANGDLLYDELLTYKFPDKL